MDELQIIECPEYGFHYETILDKENKMLYLTFDLSKIPRAKLRLRSRGLILYFDEESFSMDYPEGVIVDPESAKIKESNGVLDITLKILRFY